MLPILLVTWLFLLPTSSGVINCRIACRRCREQLEHPDMLEVYCAMCDECKDRRREWLEGAPSLLRVDNNDHEYLTNYGTQDSQEDCPTTPIDEECDPPQLLTQRVTTTTTTTTSTTTRKPCPTRPCIKPTRSPCPSVPCAIPMAIPVCPMCPMQMTGPFYPMKSFPSSGSESRSTPEGPLQKLSETRSATSESYFYLGVPKKLLKQLQSSQS